MITTQGKHISHSLPSTLQKKKTNDGKNEYSLKMKYLLKT